MKIKNGFMLRKLADNFVVVSINRKSNDFNGMIQLNSTGAFIWEQLQTDKTKEELLSDQTNLSFYDYTYFSGEGDPNYLKNVLQFIDDYGEEIIFKQLENGQIVEEKIKVFSR